MYPAISKKNPEARARIYKGIIEAEREKAGAKILKSMEREEVKKKIREGKLLVPPEIALEELKRRRAQ